MAQTFTGITVALTGTKATSAPATVPAGNTTLAIQMTSSTPAWTGLTGANGTMTWGVEYSTDGGLNWRFLMGQDAAVGSDPLPLGIVGKTGALPSMRAGPYDFLAGAQVRAYGSTTRVGGLTLVVSVTVS